MVHVEFRVLGQQGIKGCRDCTGNSVPFFPTNHQQVMYRLQNFSFYPGSGRTSKPGLQVTDGFSNNSYARKCS